MSTNLILAGRNDSLSTMSVSIVQHMKKVDFVENAGLIYIGEAIPGTGTDEAMWRISRTNTEDGTDNDIAVEWASGNANFTHKWDEHLTITYS